MASVPATDPFIVFAPDVPEEEGHYPPPFEKERVGFWRNLGKATGSKSLGFGIDRIPPGERTSFTHAHGHEEELVYVLEGECSVRLVEQGKDAREVPVRAGHVVRLFTVGERKPDIEKSFYAEDLEYDAFFARERPTCHWPKDE